MKTIVPLVCLATVLCNAAVSQAGPFGPSYSVRDSLGAATSNPWQGTRTLYLTVGSVVADIETAEFILAVSGGITLVSMSALEPWANEGLGDRVLLRRSECSGPGGLGEQALRIVVSDAEGVGGRICIEGPDGLLDPYSRACNDPGSLFFGAHSGFASDGGPLCESLVVSSSSSSWSTLKSTFR